MRLSATNLANIISVICGALRPIRIYPSLVEVMGIEPMSK